MSRRPGERPRPGPRRQARRGDRYDDLPRFATWLAGRLCYVLAAIVVIMGLVIIAKGTTVRMTQEEGPHEGDYLRLVPVQSSR